MKTGNEYAYLLSAEFYERTPKAVFAALAVSFANQCDARGVDSMFEGTLFDTMAHAEQLLSAEWAALHEAGLVPQKPVKPSALLHEAGLVPQKPVNPSASVGS